MQPERNTPIRANHFVDAVAELEPPIFDRDGRLFKRRKLTVDVCNIGHKKNERQEPGSCTWTRNTRRASVVNFQAIRF